MVIRRSLTLLFISSILFSCATSDKDFDMTTVADNKEFEKVVKIEAIEPQVPGSALTKGQKVPGTLKKKKSVTPKKKASPKKKSSKGKNKKVPGTFSPTGKSEPGTLPVMKTLPPRMPKIEDDEGFMGRRPVTEPYKVGEQVTLGVSYFGVEAGKFTMQVKPMVQVNGKKSYHFQYLIKSSRLFNMFYRVDDVAETFVDYETLLPYSYEIHVNESKQVRETRTFFDHKKLKATMWDKKQKRGEKVENRKLEWDLLPYAQNVFSSAYYLRNFTLRVGKKLKVNVGHEGKNIVMTADVIRKEKLYTKVGVFDTFVVKPSFDIDGKFKPTGENLLWLTADKRKFIVRLESKIKIGTIVGEVQKIVK